MNDDALNNANLINMLHRYVTANWEQLPAAARQAVTVEWVMGSDNEEAALQQLGRLFMECADLSFRQSVAVRSRHSRVALTSTSNTKPL